MPDHLLKIKQRKRKAYHFDGMRGSFFGQGVEFSLGEQVSAHIVSAHM